MQKKAQDILNALECPEGELSVLIVDDEYIAQLNQAYLQHTGPTNVIAFPMREGPHSEIHPELLGDVVISMDTCARESEMAGITVEQRFLELLIHGILHLFGYDHIHTEEEARIMEAKSRFLLDMFAEDRK